VRQDGILFPAKKEGLEKEENEKDASVTRTLIETERIFRGVIFDLERDRLREADGVNVIREVVRHPGGAGGLPLFADGRVALVRQYRHPAGKDLLEIPAGRLERGEDPAACAAREIEEEIGFRAGRLDKLAAFYSTPGFCDEVLHVYLATELTPSAQRLDSDERLEIVTLPLADALALAACGGIEDSKTMVALLMAAGR
jgi:ADP-ribose pyrophosphatase